MKKSKVLVGLVCVCLLLSCQSNVSKSEGEINIAAAMANPTELKASDYFTKVRYVPLETTDESILGNGAKIEILDDKVLVTTAQKQAMLFDKQTGRYLATVGHYGEGPEGYRASSGWVNPLTKTILLNSWHKSWCTYDANGQFKGKFVLPEGVSAGGSYVPLDSKRIVAHNMDFMADGVESVQVFTEDSLLHTIVLHEQDKNFNVNNIASLSVLKGKNSREVYGPGAGIILINFEDSPGNAYVSLIGLQRMWKVDDEIFLKTEHNDTIFRFNNYALEPAYILDLGEYHWPYEERFNMSYDHALMVARILDSRDLMIIRLVHRIYTNDKQKAYTAMYDKRTGELRIGRVEEGIIDDLTGFMPLRPEIVSPAGEYAAVVQAFDVVSWLEDHPEKKKDLPKEMAHLLEIEEEDNPVLVLFE
ncbi:DUF4934 domain-containing protein [Parabacteroides sp. OttesenSCG-928-K15]|nr:DUF4934 domain-containing protein [Parabacteroides sp. OttesenSCG-928-K15]